MGPRDTEKSVIVCINIHFSGPPSGGMASIVAALRVMGCATVGPARLPIDVALSRPDWLSHAAEIEAHGTWEAEVTAGPFWRIGCNLRGNDLTAMLAAGSDALDHLSTLGPVDFAACHSFEADGPPATLEAYRATAVCRSGAQIYTVNGPAGLGVRTCIGARLLALMD